MLNKSSILPRQTREEIINEVKTINLFGYNRFKKIFAPNEVIQLHMKNQTFNNIEKPTSSSLEKKPASSCR